MELIDKIIKALRSVLNKPQAKECTHNDTRKYRLIVKDLDTQVITRKKICSKCALSDLDNNKVFVSLY